MASKFIAKYPVPEDFPDLLHDFAREVLRDQPDNIYQYGADYFKALYMVSNNLLGMHRMGTNRSGGDFPSSTVFYEGKQSNLSVIKIIKTKSLTFVYIGCSIRLRKQRTEHSSST